MTYFSHISTCIAKSFTAKGRTSLVQYACLTSFQWLVCLVMLVSISCASSDAATTIGIIWGVYLLVSLPTMWSATIRRLHDVSSSGWNIAILVVPMWRLWLFWDLWTPGDEGENEYGSPVMETMGVQSRMKTLFKVIRVIAVVLPVMMTVGGILGRISRNAVKEQMENRIETADYSDYGLSQLLREYNMTCPMQDGPVTREEAELDLKDRMFQYNYTINSEAGFDVHVQEFKAALSKERLSRMVEQIQQDPGAVDFLGTLVRYNYGVRFRYVVQPENDTFQIELSASEIRQILNEYWQGRGMVDNTQNE